jgi:ElaB/YqjD/DUF883 family membrane-anchored ribosome-binding protein
VLHQHHPAPKLSSRSRANPFSTRPQGAGGKTTRHCRETIGAHGRCPSVVEWQAERIMSSMDSLDGRADEIEDDLEDAGRSGMEIVQDSLADLYDGLADESSRAVETIEQKIEEHPWLSLFVGFGLGCLIGSALLRRR